MTLHVEAIAFNRHREKQQQPINGSDPEGSAESLAFAKHRFNHQPLPVVIDEPDLVIEPGLVDEPDLATKDEVTGNIADVPVKLQLAAWSAALVVIDASEVAVRELIESGLAAVRAGDIAENLPAKSRAVVTTLVTKVAFATVPKLVTRIATIRSDAIKAAFRLVRDRLGDVKVIETSLAKWAAYFAKAEIAIIDSTIRAALVNGDDNTEIARKVVGSAALNGVDGVTEYTRHKIAHLGRAGIRAFNLRKAGQTIGPFDKVGIQ